MVMKNRVRAFSEILQYRITTEFMDRLLAK